MRMGLAIGAALLTVIMATEVAAQSEWDLARIAETMTAAGCEMTREDLARAAETLPLDFPLEENLGEMAARGAIETEGDRLRLAGCVGGREGGDLDAATAVPASPAPADDGLLADAQADLVEAMAFAWCEMPRADALRRLQEQGLAPDEARDLIKALAKSGAVLFPIEDRSGRLRLSEAECLGLGLGGEAAAEGLRVVLSARGCVMPYEEVESAMLARGWTTRQVSSGLNVLWSRERLDFDGQLVRLPASGCGG